LDVKLIGHTRRPGLHLVSGNQIDIDKVAPTLQQFEFHPSAASHVKPWTREVWLDLSVLSVL
jgi:hypothetical protein